MNIKMAINAELYFSNLGLREWSNLLKQKLNIFITFCQEHLCKSHWVSDSWKLKLSNIKSILNENPISYSTKKNKVVQNKNF